MNRRQFLRHSSLGSAGFLASGSLLAAEVAAPKPPLFSAVGLTASISKAKFAKEAGCQFLTESVSSFLVPDQPDSVFAASLAKLAGCPLPILACNSFIRHAHLRAVGSDANHDEVLKWADIAFRRLKQVGGKYAIFGSSGARILKDGWPKEKAEQQFVALLKAMGPLAEKQGVTVVLEQLRADECNFINHLGEGATLIRAAGHPHIRLLADFFHMAAMGDGPAELKSALDVVVHVEIAENNKKRSVPGVAGDDFRPFFRVLREGGYQGAINMEANYTDPQLAPAVAEILKQAADS
jgi:sugar phosphate isomerase/epimerase